MTQEPRATPVGAESLHRGLAAAPATGAPRAQAGRWSRRRRTAGRRASATAWTWLWGAVTSLAWSLPSPALAACKMPQMTMPVRIVEHRPIATVKVNGVPVQMLVDSGAFFSFLSTATAAQLELRTRPLPSDVRIEGHTGRIEARLTRVATLGLQDAELKNVEFLVGGNELGAGIMGVLGRNLLSMADTEYDLAHGEIHLSFPNADCRNSNLAHWAGEAPVVVAPLETDPHTKDTSILIETKVNGTRLKALMDTGAANTALNRDAARRAGLDMAQLTPAGRTGGFGAGRAQVWWGEIALLEIGGQKLRNSRLRVDDVDSDTQDLLLGLDYFLAHRIYVSRLQGKVYITWNGTPVFNRERGGVDAAAAQYAAVPRGPSSDDADALARRGEAATAAGDHARALEDLDRAVTLAPDNADHAFARARLLLRMKEPARALTDLDNALRLNPGLTEARMLRARVRMDAGNRPGAFDDVAVLDNSLLPTAHLRKDMAALLASVGALQESLKQSDLWLLHHPDDEGTARVLNGRCWLRTRLAVDLPLALKECRRAVSGDRGEASFHDSLGWTQLRLGDAKQAWASFNRAIELAPGAFSLFGRALAALRLNDRASAERDLAEARRLEPTIDEKVKEQGFAFAEAAVAGLGPKR